MTIICIEGPSAVGKTTVCQILEDSYGFTRIPEVNELYIRSQNEAPFWYFERQLNRWERARDISLSGGIAVLDGDPFQPIWYNWIFMESGIQSIPDTLGFYREQVQRGAIRVPDKYYVLTASEEVIRKRKDSDLRRLRRNFDKHLGLVAPQLTFFRALDVAAPALVTFLEADDARRIAKGIASARVQVNDARFYANAFAAMTEFVQSEHGKRALE